MSETLSANVIFEPDSKIESFQFHAISTDNPWRFLANDFALELLPICTSYAQKVSTPPLCDRFEVWPVRWGYPQSLIADHPEDVAEMKKHHFPDIDSLPNGTQIWEQWLNDVGVFELWFRYRTPELQKLWLNIDNVISTGKSVFKLPGHGERDEVPTLPPATVEKIRFRADFYIRDQIQTVFLAECLKSPLTTDEKSKSPSWIKRQELLAQQQLEVQSVTANNLAEQTKILAQRARQAVTREQVCKALNVRERQLRSILKREGCDCPENQDELDSLLALQREYKKKLSAKLADANRRRKEQRIASQSPD